MRIIEANYTVRQNIKRKLAITLNDYRFMLFDKNDILSKFKWNFKSYCLKWRC